MEDKEVYDELDETEYTEFPDRETPLDELLWRWPK